MRDSKKGWAEGGRLLAFVLLLSIPAMPAAAAKLNLTEAPAIFNLGVVYARADGQDIDEGLDGWGVFGSVDEIAYDGHTSLGFSFTYFTAEKQIDDSGTIVDYSYRSIPARIVFKAYLGNVDGWAVGYAGAGLGVGFNRVDRTTSLGTTSTFSSSVSAGVTVGALAALGKKNSIDVSYTFNFLNDSFFTDDLAHIVAVSIGFRR